MGSAAAGAGAAGVGPVPVGGRGVSGRRAGAALLLPHAPDDGLRPALALAHSHLADHAGDRHLPAHALATLLRQLRQEVPGLEQQAERCVHQQVEKLLAGVVAGLHADQPTTGDRYQTQISDLNQTQSAAVLALGVGQLARVLDQEARLAHELARALGQDLGGTLGPVLGVGDLVLLVLLLVDDDEAVLQDDVEPGLHVVGVDVVVVLVIIVVVGHHDHADRHLGLLVDVDIDVDLVEDIDVVLDEIVLVLVVERLEIDDVRVVGVLDVIEFLVRVIRHSGASVPGRGASGAAA